MFTIKMNEYKPVMSIINDNTNKNIRGPMSFFIIKCIFTFSFIYVFCVKIVIFIQAFIS